MSTSENNPHWDTALRLEKQALALDERVFNAMDCAVSVEQQLMKVEDACNFLRAKVERLEDEKQALLERQKGMAEERSDLRSRLTASMAVAAASSSAAAGTEHELAQLKRDYELYRQRTQIDVNSRKVELDAARLEVKEKELSIVDARAAAKAAELRIEEMERNHSQTFGELFVAKEDLEEEYQLICNRANQAEESEAVAWKRVDEERSTRSVFESRIVDSALLGLALREEVENIYREMSQVVRDLEDTVRESAEHTTREVLQAAKTNKLLQAQMLEAVQVIAHAQTDIVAFREFTEESQNEAVYLATQSDLQVQKLNTAELELAHARTRLETSDSRIHVLEHQNSEMQRRLDEDAHRQGRVESVAAENASRSNQEIVDLLRERQELGAGFDEAIERTNAAEEELGEVRKQVEEMKSNLLLLERDRDRCREDLAQSRREIVALKDDIAVKDDALSLATDESMSLKHDRQLEMMRKGAETREKETALKGLILDLQSASGAAKEVHAAMVMAERHFVQCCEVRSQTLEELQRQKDRTSHEMGELRERAQRLEKQAQEAACAQEQAEMEAEAANQRTEMAEGKMAEAVREVVRERGVRSEAERKLEQLAGLTKALDSDVKEAMDAGDTQQQAAARAADTSVVRDKDVFLLMAELDASESAVLAKEKELGRLQEREQDARIEIARLQGDFDALRAELRSKQRNLNLANVAAGEAVERARTADARAGEAQEARERERQRHGKAARLQERLAEGLKAALGEAVAECQEARAELEAAEAHFGQCCEARIDSVVEMQGVKETVVELRRSAEQAQAEVQLRSVQLCGAIAEAQAELREVRRETEKGWEDSVRALELERSAREGMEGRTEQMAGLLEQLHSDATRVVLPGEEQPAAGRAARDEGAAVKEEDARGEGVQSEDGDPREQGEEEARVHAALAAAERRAEETRRIILKEQGARAETERRLREMAGLARALHAELGEAMAIQAEVAPALMLKRQSAEDVYLLMAELDASETAGAEHANRAAALAQREAALQREVAGLQEALATKQEKYTVDLAEVHLQLSQTADDNKDLVARLFQAKQASFEAARAREVEAVAMAAGMGEAEGVLHHLGEVLQLIAGAGAERGGSTRALEEELAELQAEMEMGESKREELQGRLVESANKVAKLKAEAEAEQLRGREAREVWAETRGSLAGEVERLHREMEEMREDLHRSNMVIVQLETRALKADGPLASALSRQSGDGEEWREVRAHVEAMRGGLRTVEQRCETLDAEIKEAKGRERELFAEKHALEEKLRGKTAEAESVSVDLLTSLKDLDDSRGKVKALSKQLREATEASRSLAGDLGSSAGASEALSSLEEMLGASHLEARRMVEKVSLLEGTGAVLRQALAQSEARGGELQTLLTEATSRIAALQGELSGERRRHDDERLLVDAEFAACAGTLREAQGRASALEAENRVFKEEIAALHAKQYADAPRMMPRKALAHSVDLDPDTTKSTVVASGRERGMSVRGMEVSWSPIRADGELGSDGGGLGHGSRFGRGALLDEEWMRGRREEGGSVVGGLDVTEHEMSWDHGGGGAGRRTPGGARGGGQEGGGKGLVLRGGLQGAWEEEGNMRLRLAEERAAQAQRRSRELAECVQRLQDECRLLRAGPGEGGGKTEQLTLDLLTALKNLDEARAEGQASTLQLAAAGEERLRLSEELRQAAARHQGEVEGLRAALSQAQAVRARANAAAAEVLGQVRALQESVREEHTDEAATRGRPAAGGSGARGGILPGEGAVRGQTRAGERRTLEGEKEQLAIKLEALRSALQAKDQKLGVLEKCLEMAAARESDLFGELHAMHVDMCSDWQAIFAASARRAGGAEQHLLSMIGENKLMSAEPSNSDLAKKVSDMRGVYKKVVVEMKRAHSKLISELETALGAQEGREGDMEYAHTESHGLRLQVAALSGKLAATQTELASARMAQGAVEQELQGAEARARAREQEAAAAKEFARSERGKSHVKDEEAEGLKSRIITLVRKVEQSRQQASSARGRGAVRAGGGAGGEGVTGEQELQLQLREEHLQALQRELLAVHESQQDLKAAHERFKEQEGAWRRRVAELEEQLARGGGGAAGKSAGEMGAEAVRAQLREEQERRDVVEQRCAEEEALRKELEVAVRRLQQGKAEAEAEAAGLRARVQEKEEQRGRALRVETRKAELEGEAERLQGRLREAEQMQAVLREEGARERQAGAGAMRQAEALKREVTAGRGRARELEGQLRKAVALAEGLQREASGMTELVLAVELAVMAESRSVAGLQGQAKAAAGREQELQLQVQALRSALHEHAGGVPPGALPRGQNPEEQGEGEGGERGAAKKARALEGEVSELRQRELRWEETAGRYKRELSAVRRELDTALDVMERARREKEGLERGRSAREAKLEGELRVLEQRLGDERARGADREAEIQGLLQHAQPSRRPRQQRGRREIISSGDEYPFGVRDSRY